MNKHDPIQHLRELLAKHRGLKPAWNNYGSAALFERNQVQAITAITNALPALLAVAEALAKHKTTAEEYMDMSDRQKTTMRGRRLGSRAEAEYHTAIAALAKLDEVKPS